MSIRFKVDGMDVEADSATEAAQFLREYQSGRQTPMPALPPKKTQGNGSSSTIPRLKESEREHAAAAIRFLQLIKESPAGVNAEAVMPVLGATVPKGVGSRLASVNKVLDRVGVKSKKAYHATRTRTGRVWRKKSQITNAINALQVAVDR